MILNPGISLAVVHPGTVSFGWHESVLHTITQTPFEYHLISAESGPLIASARNHVVERFLEETEDDYLLSTDTDIIWKPEIIEQLVADDVPIVSALAFSMSQTGDPFPICTVLDEETSLPRRSTLEEVEEGGLKEVHGVGMALTLIKREVLEALGTRLFWPYEEISYKGQPTGEDITFCIRARSKGYRSYVDLGARVGHRKAVTL